jgi:alkylhydroperoxidase family enzyme
VESHAEFLRLETLDGELSECVRQGKWREAPGLSEREFALLEYTEKLTRSPARVHPGDLDLLRAVGLDDTGILQANLIASWFNYINRVADGLGVGREG